MARKKIHATKFGRCAVTIYRDAEYGEFIVTTAIGGRVDGGAGGGYHTDDKSDARGTAAQIVKKLRRERRC